MSNNNTHSILFELQRNLENLSSAREQVDFFREKSLEITDGISDIQHKYTEHLQSIKSDYENQINNLKNELTEFLSEIQKENTKSITKGIKRFDAVSDQIETSNNEKIEAINNLLEHYENVVEVGNSLIETLTTIDFPTKLDALSSKSQLIVESVTNAKQALEIKLNESQNSVIKNNDNKISLLTEKIVETNNSLKTNLLNNFEKQINETKERLNKQDKEISTLKTLLFVVIGVTIIGIIISLVVK
jgi:DNA repair exonuclease SbcCD ATPase subunit